MENNMQEQINCLIQRVADLEHLGLNFYAPLIISLMALGVTIYHFIIKRKSDNLDRIESNIDNARVYLSQTLIEMYKSKDIEKETKSDIIEVSKEHLYNKFDDACRKYLKNKINKKEFKHKYNQVIIDLIENDEDVFKSDLNRFDSMMKYYKNNKKQ